MDVWIGTVKQDGMVVAEVSAPSYKECVREVAHYAMYGQDGPVEIETRHEGSDQ